MSGERSAVLDSLRERIRLLEGGAPVQRSRAPSGVPEVDRLIGGLPVPGVVELTGARGSGVTSLALHLAAAEMRAGGLVAWVDSEASLYPPALDRLGVELSRLLVVRPPADGQHSELWAAEQLLRSGCFGLVVVDRLAGGVLRSTGHGWARACERGHSVALVLGENSARWLPAEVRLAVGDGRLTVVRDRGGRTGSHSPLPAPPPMSGPWQ
ncbi:MAG: hypothetical protein ACI8PZ_005375 [Myxococcota bacterium]|jgi:hypothetical protein